jgi:hypothetical protein
MPGPLEGAVHVKFKRATLFRTAIATTSAVLATLTLTAIPAPAEAASSSRYIELCNYLTNSDHAIDVWEGSTWLGKTWHNQCAPIYVPPNQTVTVRFFLNNDGLNLGGLTYKTTHDWYVGFNKTVDYPFVAYAID